MLTLQIEAMTKKAPENLPMQYDRYTEGENGVGGRERQDWSQKGYGGTRSVLQTETNAVRGSWAQTMRNSVGANGSIGNNSGIVEGLHR